MSKKKERTGKAKAAHGHTGKKKCKCKEVSYGAIYLNLNGNNALPNIAYLRQCIESANEYNLPLYVSGNAGNPPQPPSCPPGWPC